MSEVNTVLTIPEPGRVELKDTPYPRIVPGFVLVRVAIAPICIEHQIFQDHTFEWMEDEERMGHEGVGEIVEVAAGSRFEVGDRVIMYQGYPCGECHVCSRGLSPSHCLRVPLEEIEAGSGPHTPLETLGGSPPIEAIGRGLIEARCNSPSGGWGFSQLRIVPETMAQKIPDELSFRYAATANCTFGCTYTATEELGVHAGDHVLVAGIGFIGFGAIVNAKYRGAKVIALGRNQYRMELAKRIGADLVLNPEDPNWLEELRDFTGYRQGVDHGYECSGYPYYQTKCLAALRRYGGMFCLGFLPGSSQRLPVHVLDEIINRHIAITGGHDVRWTDRQGLVDMLLDPEVQRCADLVITHEFNMSDGQAAFEAALSKKAGKLYLYPWEDCPQ